MKKIMFYNVLFLTSFLFAVDGNTQTLNDFFNKKDSKVIWLGIDYSHVRLIGELTQFETHGYTRPADIKEKYFDGWNTIFIREKDKYDLAKMIRRTSIDYNIKGITQINSLTSVEDMVAAGAPCYVKSDIENFIENYDFLESYGTGIMLLAEYINDEKKEAKYHFLVINLRNKALLLNESFIGSPGGIGLKNYWARSFYDVITQIEKKRFKKWKKEFSEK